MATAKTTEKEAPAITKVRTVAFDPNKHGDLPKRSGGFTRPPNPFDDVLAAVMAGKPDENGAYAHQLTEVAYKDPAELKPYVNLLRNAAKHVGIGLDLWTVEAGIVWQLRPKREVTRNGSTSAK